ncbi:hypothetical protein LOZ39_000366 [Ophidiomyces ophidiicola]|uniref:Uncharacterized protein n=1 Tax=Ophidiomyces ophidiicola TaxID=1387563 RepID=A0ACB8V1V5_9EURO|nr:uncharacterized protein LOZ57_005440 [Ophidiomyces ophidiicola]KAI1917374.1 hypothetical protein LOZ61_000437 [Ophidiomyces ophidiicola]KAI1924399.1 hypothetical protein LOZ64_000724 [Ophidiomyces ophidiicola]KAI1929300.1 hypothetical protein LOZ60_001769 [Ophidiomyces ophidiicola]KAI1942217.1 hypothetical protein LOZ57_005440 [Ophidiomyces ophidiicola]KAI1955361.1 hypothetical protein LOZ59_004599 [Ophidiomyces ophidiicola]
MTANRTIIDRIKSIVLDDLKAISILARDGIRSGAYTYPFQGIIYFLTHRSLWKPLLSSLAPTVTLSIAVTASMFFFTYIPQTAILAFTNGPLAPISAALLVLSESSTIINFLARSFISRDSLTDIFDGTLLLRGETALVARERQLNMSMGDPMARLGRMLRRPFVGGGLSVWLRSLIYLPLNFVPVVGSLIYFVGQGRRVGNLSHLRYFELKGWNVKEKEDWLKKNRAAYTSFGAVAFFLEIIPFASLAFTYTNTVGAALWASNLENSMSTAPKPRNQAKKAT